MSKSFFFFIDVIVLFRSVDGVLYGFKSMTLNIFLCFMYIICMFLLWGIICEIVFVLFGE